MHPSEGIRILLERRSVAGDRRSASYAASIFTPSERFDYGAELSASGEVELRPVGAGAGEEMEKKLLAIARSAARAAGRKLEEDLPPWPHRVLRWRGPGRG